MAATCLCEAPVTSAASAGDANTARRTPKRIAVLIKRTLGEPEPARESVTITVRDFHAQSNAIPGACYGTRPAGRGIQSIAPGPVGRGATPLHTLTPGAS